MASNETFRNKQVTGNIGLYYVCYELSKLGWNVLPTSRNTKGVDLVMFDNKRKYTLQVKALSYRNPVIFGRRFSVDADYLVIVRIDKNVIYVTKNLQGVEKQSKLHGGHYLSPKIYEKYDSSLEKVFGNGITK
jgi:hypothetical protein